MYTEIDEITSMNDKKITNKEYNRTLEPYLRTGIEIGNRNLKEKWKK